MYHVPVMPREVIQGLNVKRDMLYLDGTAGGGGHSELILKSGGKLIAIDRDADAIDECQRRFECPEYNGRFRLVRDNFKNAAAVLENQTIDGALLDLGVSSKQIDDPQRGFSYMTDAPLDMRMNQAQHLTAETIINEYNEDELQRILFDYGEERYARRIVRAICEARKVAPIATTAQLVQIIKKSVPFYDGHPAKRTFQAIRIEVNNELKGLDNALKNIFYKLNKGGRLCVIAFHSLEDRVVKQVFKSLSEGCICDKTLPSCVCGHIAEGKLIGKFKATDDEKKNNSRSASAILRVIERI